MGEGSLVRYRIATIPGDGVGPDVVAAARAAATTSGPTPSPGMVAIR